MNKKKLTLLIALSISIIIMASSWVISAICKPEEIIETQDVIVVEDPEPLPPSAVEVIEVEEEVEEIVEDKPTPSFFRTNAQSITKIEQKWQEALGNTTKTAVIRFVKSHDHSTGYFKLAGYTNEQLADEFNKAQTKYKFTENDFENANKPLKK